MDRYDDDPYQRLLGLRPFINASGNSTTLGGSVMPEEVVEAMAAAARSFIDLNSLHRKAGEKLAEMIGVEAAFISCGASSGVAMCAAACMTKGNPERVASLPHTEAFPDEFVISLIDPHVFVHQGIESVGGKLIKVGSRTDASTADMVAAIGPRTAAVVLFYGLQSKQDLAELASAASERGVPVIVDAAAQLPPRSNLTSLLDLGASAVVFSGGKAIRGPQSTGLVLGQADLVEAVRLNANPFTAIGRGMKVGKEEIVGLVAAVELFLAADEGQELARWREDLEAIAAVLNTIDGGTGRGGLQGSRGCTRRGRSRIRHVRSRQDTAGRIDHRPTPGRGTLDRDAGRRRSHRDRPDDDAAGRRRRGGQADDGSGAGVRCQVLGARCRVPNRQVTTQLKDTQNPSVPPAHH